MGIGKTVHARLSQDKNSTFNRLVIESCQRTHQMPISLNSSAETGTFGTNRFGAF
jgi:hypothetical protein